MPRNMVSKTFTVTAEPAVMRKLERLLALMHFATHWGHTGIFGMHLDGDGADKLTVEGADLDSCRAGVSRITGVGYDVELATGNGFSGLFEDRVRHHRKWSYRDDGTTRPRLIAP